MSSVTFEHVDELLARLRTAGLALPVDSVICFFEALALLDDDVRSIHLAGRATLAHSQVEAALYDAVFRSWLVGDGHPDQQPDLPVDVVDAVAVDADDDGDPIDAETDGDGVIARASRHEMLRTADLDALDADERAEVDRLVERLRPSIETRRSRRRRRTHRPARRADDRIDLRGAMRSAMRNGGEVVRLPSSRRVERPRPVVLLVDISGSMAPYARAMLRFSHAVVRSGSRVEVFALGTRLTRLSRELATVDPDVALERAAAAVEDWSGGTRLGEGLRTFNDRWGVRGMARGAVVVILSDGWDRGAPEEMAEQMARLARVAHRIVWVNPLRATPGYEPLARGMAAALPFVDDFVDGHSLASLESLVDLLGRSTAVRSRRAIEVER